MKLLRLSPRAESDLEGIAEYIARDNRARAFSFVEELLSLCRRLPENPQAYPRRDGIRRGIRLAVHGRYLILFRVLPSEIRVERIVHSARDLSRILKS
jgi:plasmid stabilization system protein ParE